MFSVIHHQFCSSVVPRLYGAGARFVHPILGWLCDFMHIRRTMCSNDPKMLYYSPSTDLTLTFDTVTLVLQQK